MECSLISLAAIFGVMLCISARYHHPSDSISQPLSLQCSVFSFAVTPAKLS